jgi:hypothetical protein
MLISVVQVLEHSPVISSKPDKKFRNKEIEAESSSILQNTKFILTTFQILFMGILRTIQNINLNR